MANRKGRWSLSFRQFNLSKKSEVLDLVNKTIDLAETYVKSIKIPGYKIEIDKEAIQKINIGSGKQGLTLITELLALNRENIKLNNNGLISDIDIKTDLGKLGDWIKITRVNRYRAKTGKILYYDSQTFTASQFKELLKQQRFTNAARKEYGLSEYHDIQFAKNISYEKAIQIIAKAGDTSAIINRILGDVKGVLQSLESSVIDSDTDYYGVDSLIAQAIMARINEYGYVDSYFKIKEAMEAVGQDKFVDVYGSDKEVIRDTGLMGALAEAFDITFNYNDINTESLSDEDKEILKDKSDRGELKYSDILILDGRNIKW